MTAPMRRLPFWFCVWATSIVYPSCYGIGAVVLSIRRSTGLFHRCSVSVRCVLLVGLTIIEMPASDASSPNVARRTKEGTALLPDKNQIKKWNRSELEERYLETCLENGHLKKRTNEQDEQLQKQQRTRNLLATKLLKLTNAKGTNGQGSASADGRQQIDLAEVHNYVFELEQQNMLLRDKLKSAKYQLNAYSRFPLAPGPGHRLAGTVSGRTSRGTTRPIPNTAQASPSGKMDTFSLGPVDTTLLRQAEETIGKQRQQIAMYEAEITALKQQVRLKDASFDDELARLQSQIMSEQRMTTNENIETIRMQKIVRDQANEISVLQVRCNKFELDLRNGKSQQQNSLLEIDQLKAKLHTEQTVNAQLQMELRSTRSSHDGNAVKLNQEIETLKRENEILKEGSDRILANAFNVEREKQWEATERALMSQMVTLEAAVKADAATKTELLEKLASEMAGKDNLEQQLGKLQVQNVQLKAEIEAVQQKLNKLTTAQGVEYVEIEEAIAYIRQKKDAGELIDMTIPDFVTQLSPEERADRDAKEELANLQLSFAEAVQELEKTRNMLLIQYKINQDFKAETEEISQRSERLKEEYERKVKEYSQMLDERALRIQKLERQLYDVAYGTRAPQPVAKQDVDQTSLEPGRNLLELHLSELKLTEDALRLMQSLEPNTFMTIEFYDFEIQFTPMLTGANVPLDFTCQYNVMVNDLFLHYMQTECAHVELHQAIGSHYRTWAAGKIYLKDVVSEQEGKSVGSAELLGINTDALMVSFGEVKFAIQLRVPAERALRFYKDRVKSLGYLVDGNSALEHGKTNQLHIHIHRCRDLKSNDDGAPVPCIYGAYQFFEFPDHDTKIAPPGCNPELSDHAVWPVTMDTALDHYLKNHALRIYVLDDSAADDTSAYVGHADIPLLPLARNKTISGTFRLMNGELEGSGSIDVSLNWQYTYIAPMDSTVLAEPMIDLAPPADIRLPADPEKVSIATNRPAVSDQLIDQTLQAGADQTAVIIQHQPPPVAETSAQEDQRKEEEPSRPKLERSATFEKLADASDQPSKVPRKTWDKKTPTAPPRKARKGANETGEKGLSQEVDPADISSGESEGEIIIGQDSQTQWPDIVFDIHSLRLPEHSPLLKDEAVTKIFLEWSLLDLPPDECETPNSYEKPTTPRRTVDINLHKVIPMNASRMALLKSMLSKNEDFVLTLLSDPGDDGECVDLGTAIIDLKQIDASNKDLVEANVNVVAPNGSILAILSISFKATEAIRTAVKM